VWVKDDKPLTGHVIMERNNGHQRRTEVWAPAYHEISIINGDRQYDVRTTRYEPMRISEMLQTLAPFRVEYRVTTSHVRRAKENGHELLCAHVFQIDPKGHRDEGFELCVYPDTMLPAAMRYKTGREGTRTVAYANYLQVGDKFFPGKIEDQEDGRPVLSISVNSVRVGPIDEVEFHAPENARVWPHCDKWIPPQVTHEPEPIFPPGAARRGEVFLRVTVDEQGNVHDPEVLETLGTMYDDSAKAAVRQWKFEPAKCGATPIPVEINVAVEFKP
jgi:TonB family protein